MITRFKCATLQAACVAAAAGFGALSFPAVPVRAQSAAGTVSSNASTPASPDSASGEALQEVTVPANRRDEHLQRVPLVAAVVTDETTANMGITDAMTLANSIPGLNFERQGSASIPFLRGIGTPVGQAGDEPSVDCRQRLALLTTLGFSLHAGQLAPR